MRAGLGMPRRATFGSGRDRGCSLVPCWGRGDAPVRHGLLGAARAGVEGGRSTEMGYTHGPSHAAPDSCIRSAPIWAGRARPGVRTPRLRHDRSDQGSVSRGTYGLDHSVGHRGRVGPTRRPCACDPIKSQNRVRPGNREPRLRIHALTQACVLPTKTAQNSLGSRRQAGVRPVFPRTCRRDRSPRRPAIAPLMRRVAHRDPLPEPLGPRRSSQPVCPPVKTKREARTPQS